MLCEFYLNLKKLYLKKVMIFKLDNTYKILNAVPGTQWALNKWAFNKW